MVHETINAVINLYLGFKLAASACTLHIPDTQLLVELALVSCFSCPLYQPWRTGPQCLELPGAQWIWGQHTGSQVVGGMRYFPCNE